MINVLVKKIDTKALDNIIETNKVRFLVMNTETHREFMKDSISNENWSAHGASYEEYKKIPIAVCEKLNYGEIEIL